MVVEEELLTMPVLMLAGEEDEHEMFFFSFSVSSYYRTGVVPCAWG